jgi:hypothetical protein
MAERLDEWPRVHTCLRNWCPSKNDECERCDEVCRLLGELDRAKGKTPRYHSDPEVKP